MKFEAKQDDKENWGVMDTETGDWILQPRHVFTRQSMVEWAAAYEVAVPPETEIIKLHE